MVMSVSDTEYFPESLTFAASVRVFCGSKIKISIRNGHRREFLKLWRTTIRTFASALDEATLLATVLSSMDISLPLSFIFDTNPNLNEPTSGSMSHKVLVSLLVMPLRVTAEFGLRCWTETPQYRNFLNFVSNWANLAASSLSSLQ